MSRLEKLKEMLAADPKDAFVRYGLAMEYRSADQTDEARQLFEGLMNDEPPHVPSFFMLGQMLADNDEMDEAKSILESGITEARKQGNDHAAGEMTELLQML